MTCKHQAGAKQLVYAVPPLAHYSLRASGPSKLASYRLTLTPLWLHICIRGAAATALGLLTLKHCTCCRSDSEAKSSQLAEVTESKEGLEAKLEQLAEAHAILTQQHEGLTTEMSQVQGALQTAEEGRASAEVLLTACAVQPVAQSTCSYISQGQMNRRHDAAVADIFRSVLCICYLSIAC